VIYAYIFGIVIFSDRITWAGAAGSLLIAFGIFLVNSSKSAPAAQGAAAPAPPVHGGSPRHVQLRAGSPAVRPSKADDYHDGGSPDMDYLSACTAEKTSAAARDAAGAGVGSVIALRTLAAAAGFGGGGGSSSGGGGGSSSGGGLADGGVGEGRGEAEEERQWLRSDEFGGKVGGGSSGGVAAATELQHKPREGHEIL
jgi:hypothetical protein